MKVDQLRQAVVGATVSSQPELTLRGLADDKMAAPVAAPSREGRSEQTRGAAKVTTSPVGQDVSDGFIAEADEEAAQRFTVQQVFSGPDGQTRRI